MKNLEDRRQESGVRSQESNRDPSVPHRTAQIPGLTAGAGCERRDGFEPAFSPARKGGVELTNGLRSERGVTLIEMLVVVVIIGLFVAIVGPRLFSRAEEAKRTAAKTQIANFNQTLGLYKLDVGTYPTTEQGLLALRVKPDNVSQWNGPYLQQDVPLDPWGRQYVYQYPGEHGDEPDISSLGPDGMPSGDDIVSWKNQ